MGKQQVNRALQFTGVCSWLLAAGLLPCLLGACSGDTSCADNGTCSPNGTAQGGKAGSGGGSSTGAAGATGGTTHGGSGGAGGKTALDAGRGGTGGTSDASVGGTGAARGSEGGPGTDASPDGLADAHIEHDGAPPPCDASTSHPVAGCVIDDPDGLYVSPNGSDTSGDGSRTKPFASIGKAIAATSPHDGGALSKSHVYACADGGELTESVTIGKGQDGLLFSGGFRCSDWKYDPRLETKVSAPSANAWTITGIKLGITIENFQITSASQTVSATSSIAMIVNASANVVLRRTTVRAGDGADGARGDSGTDGLDGGAPYPTQVRSIEVSDPSLYGGVGACMTDFAGKYCGGSGGYGYQSTTEVPSNRDGKPGTPTTNVTPPLVDNHGAAATVLVKDGGSGTDGSRGNDGVTGSGATRVGTFSASGYGPANGGRGGFGYPGQGGGGGGSSKGDSTCGSPGGGGGAPGLGGTPGGYGVGGGASVALLLWQSTVTLENVTLVAANGGTGGDGGPGGLGGKGHAGGSGEPGLPGFIGKGGNGGKGGDGGNGGPGGGGTGGPSFALVLHGTAPVSTGLVLTAGQGGLKGIGASMSNPAGTVHAADGTDGTAAAEYDLP